MFKTSTSHTIREHSFLYFVICGGGPGQGKNYSNHLKFTVELVYPFQVLSGTWMPEHLTVQVQGLLVTQMGQDNN